MRQAAPWSPSLRLTTTLAVALLVIIGVGTAFAVTRAGIPAVGLLVLGVSLAALALTWALGPRGFSVDGGVLRVERRLRPVEVPLARVRAVGMLPPGALRGMLRLGGSGGMFGYYGRFWSRGLGALRLYATRTDGLVWVDVGSDLLVLSPEDAGSFVRAVLAGAPGARHAPEASLPEQRHAIPRRYWWGLGLAVGGVPLLIAAILLASWANAPRAVTVTGDAVRIERRWAGAVELPLSSVRGARVLPPELTRGWWREWGVAGLGATAYGRFRSRELGPFELYAWRRGPYVLMETTGGRVVLTPDEPEAFLAALRAAGVR